MVCAAYQSTYILDDKKQANKFSFFEGDSLILEASNTTRLKKNIYGLRERDYGYWQQERLLVVDQSDVYSEEIDSLLNVGPPEERAEFDADTLRDLADTVNLTVSEDPWANTKRFNYNVDFVNYMLLVGNDVLLAQSAARDSAAAKQEGKAGAQATDSTQNKPKGFFKRLFNKDKADKKKKQKDTSKEETGNEEATKEEDD